jgi:4-amino-4-deoxy-L-arabinose transferase-like glycosyltransferase
MSTQVFRERRRNEVIVLLVATLIFVGCMFPPPNLMDDVDAVQASIARTMLESGDWVTPRLNGIVYLEKPPLKYWMIAASFAVFGDSTWAARFPIVLAVLALCWLTLRIGAWAFSPKAGLLAGLALATCIGLFLFTRVLISDVLLTLSVTIALWAFLRLLDEDSACWAYLFWAAMGAGFLLKGLIAMIFPLAAVFLYYAVTRQLFRWEAWRRLRPLSGAGVMLAIAAPWVVLATWRNPPYIDLTMQSAPGEYRGFFWFFFLNEHLFRFFGVRYPRDYDTVPRLWFWALHLVWLFPWSAWLPSILKETFQPTDRAGRTRLLCLCFTAFLLIFFSLSTTQEYYTMPCYPALALLLGSAMDRGGAWLPRGSRVLSLVCAGAALLLSGIWIAVRDMPAPGDISRALTSNPDAYTLSLGHMKDLTLAAFAYLRIPLLLAVAAFGFGAVGSWRWRGTQTVFVLAAMMALLAHAARIAMVAFDPYLSSRRLAEAYRQSPKGEAIFDDQYYRFSSVFFYAHTRGWLLNGRINNLEYGSYAPGAPDVFLDDTRFVERWRSGRLHYLFVEGAAVPRIEGLVGRGSLYKVAESGGKFLFANQDVGPQNLSPH